MYVGCCVGEGVGPGVDVGDGPGEEASVEEFFVAAWLMGQGLVGALDMVR